MNRTSADRTGSLISGIALFSTTIFLSAFLLFQLQPMIAKMILPWFGGSAAVWITCMLFFQAVLLAGYVYAHLLINRLNPRAQAITHSTLILISFLALPVTPDPSWKPAGGEEPVLRIMGLLLTSVGLPYFLLSTTSPLMQAWYARTRQSILPYRLFALSNLASLAGLLAYPFLVEPTITILRQASFWSAGYMAYGFLCILASVGNMRAVRGGDARETAPASPDVPVAREAAPPLRDHLLWLMLSGCASLMLLAVTNHLTQNIASIPFLWVLPLSLYLLTFILCFDRSGWYSRHVYVWLAIAALGLMSYGLLQWTSHTSLKIVIPAYCAGMFICCMLCHGELSARKPSPRHLTSFYLDLSLGGAAGGLIVGLAAPRFFSGYFELILAFMLFAVLLWIVNFRRNILTDMLCVSLIAGVAVVSVAHVRDYTQRSLFAARNFYSSLRVRDYDRGTDDELRTLVHGAVNHGEQYVSPERRSEHITYYSDVSGVGLAFDSFGKRPVKAGLIGLGAGSLAGYARKGDTFRFYEINPMVEEVARRYFYYLPEAEGTLDVVLGDGRLSLEREEPQQFDLLAIDAFSGDSIPVHLLTLEAMELYFRHLKPEGILALHITNTHLDLAPVVEKFCAALGKSCLLIINDSDDTEEVFGADWVLMASHPGVLATPDMAKAGKPLTARQDLEMWTDNYNNLFKILKK